MILVITHVVEKFRPIKIYPRPEEHHGRGDRDNLGPPLLSRQALEDGNGSYYGRTEGVLILSIFFTEPLTET